MSHYCNEGWVCEEHPRCPWPHADCGGAGMPCEEPEHLNLRPFDEVLAEVKDSLSELARMRRSLYDDST